MKNVASIYTKPLRTGRSFVVALLIVSAAGWGCGGAGLPDFDGEGVPDALDCDPEDTAVYGGAEDTAGDDKDQNCDGVDGIDADGGGFASGEGSEDDCNDDDPAAAPFHGEVHVIWSGS